MSTEQKSECTQEPLMASMGSPSARIYILSSCSTHGPLLRGKAICSLPAIVFVQQTTFAVSHSSRPLLNACHMPSTILVTRDTAVSVLIQPLFQQRKESVINSPKSGSSRVLLLSVLSANMRHIWCRSKAKL